VKDEISFRMIHEPSGQPIRYVKGVETEKGFEEVPEDEIEIARQLSIQPHVRLQDTDCLADLHHNDAPLTRMT
jgi:non-homologous end joining protein Ku